MRDAKDYKNTIEFVSEKLYMGVINEKLSKVGIEGNYRPYDLLEDAHKETFRACVITVLNAVNYFEGKTCADCGYFDPTDNICFGEDHEHKEQADNPICETFAPKGLVEVTTP